MPLQIEGGMCGEIKMVGTGGEGEQTVKKKKQKQREGDKEKKEEEEVMGGREESPVPKAYIRETFTNQWGETGEGAAVASALKEPSLAAKLSCRQD